MIELMKRDMTQKQLSEMCGLSRTTVNNIAHRRPCGEKTVFKIAQALGVELEDLMEE